MKKILMISFCASLMAISENALSADCPDTWAACNDGYCDPNGNRVNTHRVHGQCEMYPVGAGVGRTMGTLAETCVAHNGTTYAQISPSQCQASNNTYQQNQQNNQQSQQSVTTKVLEGCANQYSQCANNCFGQGNNNANTNKQPSN